jgi:hypothetical protein
MYKKDMYDKFGEAKPNIILSFYNKKSYVIK